MPDMVCLTSDNGPQIAKWGFQRVMSSPQYPQSNGKAENAVKTVKRLFTKCRDSRQSKFLALLDWRNTPTEGVGTSPAQRFHGCQCRTFLPITGELLQCDYPTEEDRQAINKQKTASVIILLRSVYQEAEAYCSWGSYSDESTWAKT